VAIFSTLIAADLARLVNEARERVVYCAPGLSQEIAASLVSAVRRVSGRITVILDVSAQSARLGYGQFEGATLLQENGVAVRQQDGLRLGFIVVDDAGYAFNLPPLLVEDVAEMGLAFNAIALEPAQIARSLQALIPVASPDIEAKAASAEPDVGRQTVTARDMARLEAEFAANPPQKFDLARKVNVFNAKVEFVEMSLTGTYIGRHTAQLPRELVFATRDAETQRRVQASFRVVDDNSALGKDAKAISDRVKALRTLYLRSIGPLGSVMLRSKHDLFIKEVEKIRQEIDRFRTAVEPRLQKEIDKARQKLVDALLPAVIRTPPDDLVTQVSGKPTKDVTNRYLSDRLGGAFPTAKALITEMRLDVVFKAVTYEMLRDETFKQAVKAGFPYEEFDLLEEFQAAPAINPKVMRAAD
jgi:hypothetical protein